MNTQTWIALSEFVAKYKVSASTLRRRIKAGEIEHRFQNGKYWLIDEPVPKLIKSYMKVQTIVGDGIEEVTLNNHQNKTHKMTGTLANHIHGVEKPVEVVKIDKNETATPIVMKKETAVSESVMSPQKEIAHLNQSYGPDNFIDSANKLMHELKQAYVAVLHEKEAQIMQLKEEVANLKTLVKILESENDRLSNNSQEAAPIDEWLNKNFEP